MIEERISCLRNLLSLAEKEKQSTNAFFKFADERNARVARDSKLKYDDAFERCSKILSRRN